MAIISIFINKHHGKACSKWVLQNYNLCWSGYKEPLQGIDPDHWRKATVLEAIWFIWRLLIWPIYRELWSFLHTDRELWRWGQENHNRWHKRIIGAYKALYGIMEQQRYFATVQDKYPTSRTK